MLYCLEVMTWVELLRLEDGRPQPWTVTREAAAAMVVIIATFLAALRKNAK